MQRLYQRFTAAIIYLDAALLRRSAHTSPRAPAAYLRISEPPHLRNLALLRVGFAKPTHHYAAGALLPHRFALTRNLTFFISHLSSFIFYLSLHIFDHARNQKCAMKDDQMKDILAVYFLLHFPSNVNQGLRQPGR